MIDVVSLARHAGFDACYVLKNESFPFYKRRQTDGALQSSGQNLDGDPPKTAPWANSLLFLLTGYKPYAQGLHVSGFYEVSNRAFHSANTLLGRLKEEGIRAERIYVPVRELALRSGVGVACLNGLTAYDGFGTRASVQVLAADLPHAVYEPIRQERSCPGCGACIAACPSCAIDAEGYHFERCARAYQGKEAMPTWAMDCMESLLGCEKCQFVCPLNGEAGEETSLPAPFELQRILSGQVKPLLELVGTNLNASGRIIAQAIVLAVRQGREDLYPLVEKYAEDKRPAIISAYGYYRSYLKEAVGGAGNDPCQK
jgi:ferredoxin